MLEPWAFVLVSLAAWRLTRFTVWDSLAGSNLDSGSWWSERLDGFAYGADGADRSWWRGKVADLLVCPYCSSFWWALAVSCVWLRVWPWVLGVEGWVSVWAVAAVACVVNKWDQA